MRKTIKIMLLNYHTYPETKELTKDCKLVQLMLSSFRRPSANTARQFLQNWGVKQDIIIHYDYYRTVTRFGFMSQEYRQSFLDELVTFLQLSDKYAPKVKGVVIHADSLFSYDLYKDIDNFYQTGDIRALDDKLDSSFTSKMFNKKAIVDTIKSLFHNILSAEELVNNMEQVSRRIFAQQIAIKYQGPVKVLVENTTKNLRGISKTAYNLNPVESRTLSLCFDTEHAYAAGYGDVFVGAELPQGTSLVHLNTVPKSVEFGSYLDRHSETDLSQGKHTIEQYLSLIEKLNNAGIPYVREVKPDTLRREMELLKKF